MLTRVFNSNRPVFENIANSWLSAGAEAIYLLAYGNVLAKWPANALQSTEPNLSAPINCLGLTVGHILIKGLQGPVFQALLDANTQTLAHLVVMEGEFEAVTSELVDSQDHLLALYDITESTRHLVSVNEILRSLAQTARQLVKTAGSFTLLARPNSELVLDQFPPHRCDPNILSLFFDQVQQSRETFISNGNDVANPLPGGLKNVAICPVVVQGKISAGLAIYNKLDSGVTSPDVKLLQAIAHQAGAIIENRLLYAQTLEQAKIETELHTARQVQINLLSKKAPQVPGVQLAARSLPAREVGGDFFDFITHSDAPLTFVLGDVSGKGMPSALLMTMIRTAVRSSANTLAHPRPEQLMSRVNEDLYDDFTDVEMFATAVIGQYTPGSGQITYANAGHAPLILRPRHGRAHMLEADGPALGMLPISLSQNQTIPFGPGDLLVIGTDGFSEARNQAGMMFGYENLLYLVDEVAHLPADEIAQIFFDRIAQFAEGRPQDDDQTLMIIRGIS